ncbi:signal peptidase I [Paenibacillus sp. LMG 31456]|uniref:Signal peptidase I n=1 Tax=Paenibacillus foliorum TaxID=2654974 RepID=A0A972K308_9BACL|nr:signal peptidase I [Paenibacillus foliorum]NOU97311.1 signal peptidase I [Paenibacillus foliorum]
MLFSKEVIQLLTYTITKYGSIELPAEGNSMFPFIHKGDLCKFIPFDDLQLKKGDIFLFHTPTGQLIAHRYYQLKPINNQLYYIFKGDTNLGFDEPVNKEQILGKLIHIRKNKAQIFVTDPQAYVWGKLILTFPVVSGLLRKYLSFKESRLT